MNKDKIYLSVIILLAIALIVGFVLQTKKTSKSLSLSEIIVPEGGLEFKTSDGKVVMSIRKTFDWELVIHNNHEKQAVVIGTDTYGGVLNFCNNLGFTVTRIDIDENGGELYIGKDLLQAATLRSDGLHLANSQGVCLAEMGVDREGGVLHVSNNQGKVIWTTP